MNEQCVVTKVFYAVPLAGISATAAGGSRSRRLNIENPFDSCKKCRRALLFVPLASLVCPWQESNLHRLLRREASYPLNDKDVGLV